MESHPEIGLLDSDYLTYDPVTETLSKVYKPNQFSTDVKQGLFSGKYSICPATVIIRKSVFDQYVNLDDYIRLDFPIQDWNTFMLLSGHTGFAHIPIPLATYRIGTCSMSRLDQYDQIIKKYRKEKVMYEYVCSHCDLPFDEDGYDSYVNQILMSLAFAKNDYASACLYGGLCNERSIKKLCSQSKVLFLVWHYAKKIKDFVCK